MKKTTPFLFASIMMGWANTAHALSFGNNREMGIGQFLLLIGLHCIFLFVASKIVGFERQDFWLAVTCSLGIGALFFLMLVFSGAQELKTIGLIVVAIAAIVIIQQVYNTTLAKTLGAFLIAAIATAIAATALSGTM